MKPIISVDIPYPKIGIGSKTFGSIEHLHINPKFVFILERQTMKLVVSKPEFAMKITESSTVTTPSSVEVFATVLSPLKHLSVYKIVNDKYILYYDKTTIDKSGRY